VKEFQEEEETIAVLEKVIVVSGADGFSLKQIWWEKKCWSWNDCESE
jgi:hypothetical protein